MQSETISGLGLRYRGVKLAQAQGSPEAHKAHRKWAHEKTGEAAALGVNAYLAFLSVANEGVDLVVSLEEVRQGNKWGLLAALPILSIGGLRLLDEAGKARYLDSESALKLQKLIDEGRIDEAKRLVDNAPVAPKGIGPNDMIPDGISFDIANPKYRQFKSGEDILEYTLEGSEITVDWVNGKGASSMMKSILEAGGAGVTKISGYVTDKLGDASDAALKRLGDRMARDLGDGWKAVIETRGDRRFLIFTK